MSDPARIARWLPQARWFAGKGAAPEGLAIADEARIPGTEASLALLDVTTAGARDRYVVPLRRGAEASLEPDFAGWLVDAILSGAALPGDHGLFRGHPIAPAAQEATPASAPARVSALGGDASNTSLLVEHAGRAYAVKLVRRCRPGIQPEVEVGEFFTLHAPWKGTPRFFGWLEYAASGESIAVATLHEFAIGCTSAWDHLVPLVAGGGLARSGREAILELFATLGRTTAEMHRALASRPDIPAFAPEVATAAERRHESGRMLDHAAQVFSRAAARLEALPASVAAGVHHLLDRRDTISAALGRLAEIGSGDALIRIHGDYHLGQVLVRPPGPEALVIDFEGEPGRALADRRRKASALKDVAGMCRSFDYLLRQATRVGSGKYDPAHLLVLESRYLDAYRSVADGSSWWPAQATTSAALLDVYKLDKALYELAYELDNRPDWVEVPLAALTS